MSAEVKRWWRSSRGYPDTCSPRHDLMAAPVVGPDELDRVVDGEARRSLSRRRSCVERDVRAGVLGLEMEQCGDAQVRDLIVDRGAEEDDPLVQARAARGEAARSSA
jgi:hypothetical protein